MIKDGKIIKDGHYDIISRTMPDDSGLQDLLLGLANELKGDQIYNTGFKTLDKLIGGGLRKRMLSIVAGPAGNGKSYFAYKVFLHMLENEIDVLYLPLENTHKDTLRRIISSYFNSWKMIDVSKDQAQARIDLFEKPEFRSWAMKMQENVCRNPSRLMVDTEGKPFIPGIPFDEFTCLLHELAPRSDVIIIDPITKLDQSLNKGAKHVQEEQFVKDIKAIAESNECHIMMVSHTGKRQKHKGEEVKLAVDDLSGSVAWSRFCQYVLLLDYHGEETSKVINRVGAKTDTEHRRTLKIAKVNDGMGKGQHIAFDFKDGASMEELGLIVKE